MKKLFLKLYYTVVKVPCPKCIDLIGPCDLCHGAKKVKKLASDQYLGRYDPGNVHMYHVFGHHPEDRGVCPCRIADGMQTVRFVISALAAVRLN
jgi:hypothetical protein